ncbi:MAG: hypothetical protein Q8S36_08485 [Sulfuricurvum sp.]|nr:hypothetical protein [Sulfuricurvum sp.]
MPAQFYILALHINIRYNDDMNLQERKDTADIISKRAEVINKKIIALLAIDGAMWVYGIKENGIVLLFALFIFFISSIALITNLLKLGDLEKQLERLENE